MTKDQQAILDGQYKEVLKMIERGLSIEEIERQFGISLDNWAENPEEYPEFSTGVEQMTAKNIRTANRAIWKLAMGYEYEEKTVTEKELPNGEIEKTTTIVTRTKHPDLEACREVLRIIGNSKVLAIASKGEEEANDRASKELKYANVRHKAPAPKANAC